MAERDGELRGAQAVDAPGDVSKQGEKPHLETVKKVLFGIPLKGHTPPASYHDRMLMWKHLGNREAEDFFERKDPRYVFTLGAIGEILTPFAREKLASSAVEMGVDYLFMVDDDMICPKELFYDLVRHDVDICAPLAFTRNPDHKPVMYQTIEGYDPVTHKSYYTTNFVMNYPRNKLVECDAVGFGAVLIKTDVIKKIADSGQSCFTGMDSTGEDISFCYKAKKLGFRVFMDTSVKLGHLGNNIIVTEEYSDMHNKLTPEEKDRFYGKYIKYPSQEIM